MSLDIDWTFHIEIAEDEDSFDVTLTIKNTYYYNQPPHRGSAWTCDSRDDFYGFTECEWEVDIPAKYEAYRDQITALANEEEEAITAAMIKNAETAFDPY